MRDPRNLGTHTDPAWKLANGLPSVALYNLVLRESVLVKKYLKFTMN